MPYMRIYMKELFERLFSGSYALEYITAPFRNFGWRDAVDILLLASLFFAVFCYIRDRRAGRLLWGIGLLGAVYGISVLFDFYGLRFVFSSFFSYGLIALVIIFQPEIRSAMERVGTFSFRKLKNIGTEVVRSRSALSSAALDELVLAVKHMSFAKTGAIIAIERSIKIGEYAQSGTILDADISARLIQTIFFNMTPLHDGAVIIRDGRIFAAGCNLPLTQNIEPIKDLGTRHRAAVGASEDSDAIIIVVSEQTGIISLAVHGELYRNFTSVSLRRKLGELLGMQKTAHENDEEM